MGFRFRKSKNFGPFRVNVSKSGIGWSVGTKGARFTKRADGKKQTTLSIPGTGISYVDVHGGNNQSSGTNNDNNFINSTNHSNFNNNNNNNKPKLPFYKTMWFIWLMLIFVPPIGILLLWTSKKYGKKTRIAVSTVFALYSLVLYTPNNDTDVHNNSTVQKQQDNDKSTATQKIAAAEDKEKQLAEEKAAAEEAEKQKLAEEKAAAEEAEKQRIAQKQAATEEAEKQRVAQEQAAAEEAERQRVAQEQAAVEEAERQRVAEEQAAAQQAIGQTVYIASSGNGTKYHSNPNCSNMNGTFTLDIHDATNQGYSACKKCY